MGDGAPYIMSLEEDVWHATLLQDYPRLESVKLGVCPTYIEAVGKGIWEEVKLLDETEIETPQ